MTRAATEQEILQLSALAREAQAQLTGCRDRINFLQGVLSVLPPDAPPAEEKKDTPVETKETPA